MTGSLVEPRPQRQVNFQHQASEVSCLCVLVALCHQNKSVNASVYGCCCPRVCHCMGKQETWTTSQSISEMQTMENASKNCVQTCHEVCLQP